MRAMLFERLVKDQQFISELITKGVGQLGLERPTAVQHMECNRSPRRTVRALQVAHDAALGGIATMLTGASVPLAGFERLSATGVLPDFLLVAKRSADGGGGAAGSWVIAGDAKDYERIRSRIDDSRLLKGFLQVALGAESVDQWSAKPAGMLVHPSGVLAVPRSAYLRPEAVVERLEDHRREVRGRLAQRRTLAGELSDGVRVDPVAIAHSAEADFDPARCVTCSLFAYCRDLLRHSHEPADLMTEIGIDLPSRAIAAELVLDPSASVGLPDRVVRAVVATVTGRAQWTGARRTDPAGEPGTVNVALVKSDAAALGIHGVAVQAVGPEGPGPWQERVFREPRTPLTRMRILGLIGEALASVTSGETPLHICVPDTATADVLATLADSVAGVELSRLRWVRDLEMSREPLTFDGQVATVPDPLPSVARLATSFLLDEDRARAFAMRSPVVVLQRVLDRHLVPGGPWPDAGRLDYLVEWGEASEALEQRSLSDDVARRLGAPGARMTNKRSNEVHAAEQASDWPVYERLVRDELEFRSTTVARAIAILQRCERSALSVVCSAIEAEAQGVWRRRQKFEASDLIRFSRTSRWWRNGQVDKLDADRKCARVLSALGDPGVARDLARDAGNREFFEVEVVCASPVVVACSARALRARMDLLAIDVDDEPEIERKGVELKAQKGSFKYTGLHLGPVEPDDVAGRWRWHPALPMSVSVGQRLIMGAVAQIGESVRHDLDFKIIRPTPDDSQAPTPTCELGSFDDDPQGHRWCCRPHDAAEAEYADVLAGRRARGELNPETWPPIVDVDRFEIPGDDVLEKGRTDAIPPVPDDLTMDDVE